MHGVSVHVTRYTFRVCISIWLKMFAITPISESLTNKQNRTIYTQHSSHIIADTPHKKNVDVYKYTHVHKSCTLITLSAFCQVIQQLLLNVMKYVLCQLSLQIDHIYERRLFYKPIRIHESLEQCEKEKFQIQHFKNVTNRCVCVCDFFSVFEVVRHMYMPTKFQSNRPRDKRNEMSENVYETATRAMLREGVKTNRCGSIDDEFSSFVYECGLRFFFARGFLSLFLFANGYWSIVFRLVSWFANKTSLLTNQRQVHYNHSKRPFNVIILKISEPIRSNGRMQSYKEIYFGKNWTIYTRISQ